MDMGSIPISSTKKTHVQCGKLKGLPAKRLVNLFRTVISSDKTDFIITNDETLKTPDDTRKESAIRWKIEEFHRELK